MEKNKINIVPGEQKYYDEMLEIFNAGFLSKFRFVVRDEKLLGSFTHDFGIVSRDFGGGNFVAESDGKVLGILNLKYHGKKYEDHGSNMDIKALKDKYGFGALLRAIFLGKALNYDPPAGEAYIDNISVAEDSRGQGVGTLLMDYAKEQAKKNNCNSISLYVTDENPRAKKLYEKHGFTVKSHKSYKWMKKTAGISGGSLMVADI